MTYFKNLLVNRCFPKAKDDLPFGDELNRLFFDPLKDNTDFAVHGPNVIRLTSALVKQRFNTPGLLSGPVHKRGDVIKALDVYMAEAHAIMGTTSKQEQERVEEFLKIAALYHDIGKTIRRANHPQIAPTCSAISTRKIANRWSTSLQE